MATDPPSPEPPPHPHSTTTDQDMLPRVESVWIWKYKRTIKKNITFIPGLYRIFDQILLSLSNKVYGISRVKATIGLHHGCIQVSFWTDIEDVRLMKKHFTNKEVEPENQWTKDLYLFDPKEFGITDFEEDTLCLLRRRVVDLAGCMGKKGMNVELDGELVPVKTFKDYVKLYYPKSIRYHATVSKSLEVCVCVADEYQQVSFVNNVSTMKGGTHVDYITDKIVHSLHFNMGGLPVTTIKSCMSVFIKVEIENPSFDSPTKEKLTTPFSASMCKFTPSYWGEVKKLSMGFSLHIDSMNKEWKVDNLRDANMAATSESGECTLIIVEGDSAEKFVDCALSEVGYEKYGVFPLRGKFLNVNKADLDKINGNVVIQNIMTILGLKHSLDYDSDHCLRYGHVMIMADSDPDGAHIAGLLINVFHSLWPSLLRLPNFLQLFVTPVYTVSRDKISTSFYSIADFEKWAESLGNEATTYTVKYYKGLGSFPGECGLLYFKDLENHLKNIIWLDDDDDKAVELAYSERMITERKDWIISFEKSAIFDFKQKDIRIYDFIHIFVRFYSVSDLRRSIPSMVDGLKTTPRKVVSTALKYPIKPPDVEWQFGKFRRLVFDTTAYLHREATLNGVIIGLSRDYVGTNNINYFRPTLGFGTRMKGVSQFNDPEYMFIRTSRITRYIFHISDDFLVKYLKHGGRVIEPCWFIPIVPMVLVNGCEGVASGFKTYIPSFDVHVIIQNIILLMDDENQKLLEMIPSYRGFNGVIKSTDNGYVTEGVLVMNSDGTLSIRELPVKKWTTEYQAFLKNAKKGQNPIIKDYKDNCTAKRVSINVSLTEEQMAKAKRTKGGKGGILEYLKLTSSLSTANMHLFDADGVLKKYSTPEEILREFYLFRLEFYGKRKNALDLELTKSIAELEHQLRYSSVVIGKSSTVYSEVTKTFREELGGVGLEGASAEDVVLECTSTKAYRITGKLKLDLELELKTKQVHLDSLRETSPKELWRADLEALKCQLKKKEVNGWLSDDDDMALIGR